MTPQEKLQAKLAEAGIPSRRIHCYGSQIMVTCLARDTAQKWAELLGKFARVKAIGEGLDDTADARRYPNERRNHVVKVWRVWAAV